MFQSKIAIGKSSYKNFLILCALFLLIVLTHFGTAATTLLYAASIAITYFTHKSKKIPLKLIFSLFAGLCTAVSIFYFVDRQRFDRIGNYIGRIFDSSGLSLIFSSDNPNKLGTVMMLVVPLFFAIVLYILYKSARSKLNEVDSQFWLANIVFCYLLILPIYEPLLMARFANFLILPLIFVMIFVLNYCVKKAWLKSLILASVLIGTLAIGFGDIVNSFWHNKNKKEIYQDLTKMDATIKFTDSDLIIARNGVEHISNWFLETKSCLITSFNINDLTKYTRVFILNPTEGSMKLPMKTNEAAQWYNYMLSNVQVPSLANEKYISEHTELYQIETEPSEWIFNEKGEWISYSNIEE